MQEMLDSITQLKGNDKYQAIKALVKDPNNAPVLLALSQSEKSYFKEEALRGLACFDLEEAQPIFKKLLKSKSKGEKILLHGTADKLSDLVAEQAEQFFQNFFSHEEGYDFIPDEFRHLDLSYYTPKEFEEFQVWHSLILGKASAKMQNIYRLFAENQEKFTSFKIKWSINDHFTFYNKGSITRKNLAKVFPQTLALSIIRNPDERLIHLANELSKQYGKNWLTAEIIGAFLTQSSSVVFEKYSPLLKGKNKSYVLDALALIYFDLKAEQYTAIANWGNYHDDRNNSETYFSQAIFEPLDERWLEILTEIEPEKVPLQSYFSTPAGVAVAYESYDQLFQALLPKNIKNPVIKQKVVAYFVAREQAEQGQSLYIGTLHQLGQAISEAMIEKWIAYKPESVSKYNIPTMLDHNTDWSNQQKKDFVKKLPDSLQDESALRKWSK